MIAYHLLDRDQPYSDIGPDYFTEQQSNEAHQRRLVRLLERLGHRVTLEPTEPAAT